MSVPAYLAIGEHLVLSDPAVDWKVQLSGTNDATVVLTASIRVGSNPRPFLAPFGDSSVAIQTDQEAAIRLYEQLGAVGRSQGWLK